MVALTIVAIGSTGILTAALVSLSKRTGADFTDASTPKHWLVRAVADHPRLAAFVQRRLDRTRAGGLMLTIGLVMVLTLAAFVGWVFDGLEESRGFARFDESMAQFGADRVSDGTAPILNIITDLGGTGFVTAFTIVVALYGWWRHRNRHVAFFMFAVVAGQAAINNALKWLVDRERPAIDQLTGWAGSSFPSGHSAAAAATFAAAALVLAIDRPRSTRAVLGAAAVLLALAVGATRALLGVHWVSDVAAGLAVGWAWFTVCAIAFGGRFMQFGEPRDELELALALAGATE